MRISDWSSDVCSSDLAEEQTGGERAERDADVVHHVVAEHLHVGAAAATDVRIGRVVHFLELRQLRAAEYRVRQFGTQLHQHKNKQRRHIEQQRRSEEPTSALQSLMRHSYAVFCLTKKNKNKL